MKPIKCVSIIVLLLVFTGLIACKESLVSYFPWMLITSATIAVEFFILLLLTAKALGCTLLDFLRLLLKGVPIETSNNTENQEFEEEDVKPIKDWVITLFLIGFAALIIWERPLSQQFPLILVTVITVVIGFFLMTLLISRALSHMLIHYFRLLFTGKRTVYKDPWDIAKLDKEGQQLAEKHREMREEQYRGKK